MPCQEARTPKQKIATVIPHVGSTWRIRSESRQTPEKQIHAMALCFAQKISKEVPYASGIARPLKTQAEGREMSTRSRTPQFNGPFLQVSACMKRQNKGMGLAAVQTMPVCCGIRRLLNDNPSPKIK